jgi:mannose-6-phosphate isomerase-like protein (cupin superfamily)
MLQETRRRAPRARAIIGGRLPHTLKSGDTMQRATILKFDEIPLLDRGGGVTTKPLVTHMSADSPRFTTGISTYPVGKGAPLHVHNCDEQVTLLEGVGEVEIDGEITPLKAWDTTYIPANREHAFRNKGDTPMKILWVYASHHVTRTFAGSGETVEHLSKEDLMVNASAPKAQ